MTWGKFRVFAVPDISGRGGRSLAIGGGERGERLRKKKRLVFREDGSGAWKGTSRRWVRKRVQTEIVNATPLRASAHLEGGGKFLGVGRSTISQGTSAASVPNPPLLGGRERILLSFHVGRNKIRHENSLRAILSVSGGRRRGLRVFLPSRQKRKRSQTCGAHVALAIPAGRKTLGFGQKCRDPTTRKGIRTPWRKMVV